MKLIVKVILESFHSSVRELWTNKLRTFLSLLGISIGIFCIIAVMAAVDSMERNIKQSIQKLGSDVIFVSKWPWTFSSDYPWWKYVNRPYAKYEEYRILKSKVKSASEVAISVRVSGKTTSFEGQALEDVTAFGVSSEYGDVMNMDFYRGRYFTLLESDGGAPVGILGYEVAKQLFPGSIDPIGSTINIFGTKVKVVGVLKKEGESLVNMSNDNVIYMPFNFVKTRLRFDGMGVEPSILLKAKPNVSLDVLSDEVRGVMRALRRQSPVDDDNFAMNRISMITSFVSQIFTALNMAGVVIGAFALLVGGFGIANIMFVSVRERTNLIGIKKALGAKNFFILLEFLTESVILSMFGGLLGLLLVYLAAAAASGVVGFELILSARNIINGIVISSIIGMIAGLWPALSASRLKPVDAIRFK
jgi:putative ABC transport system permease protein